MHLYSHKSAIFFFFLILSLLYMFHVEMYQCFTLIVLLQLDDASSNLSKYHFRLILELDWIRKRKCPTIITMGCSKWNPYTLCGRFTGCEFDCIAEQNAPHFRHFATQISACIFYNVKSYINLMMNEQKIAIQNFQMNSHPDDLPHAFHSYLSWWFTKVIISKLHVICLFETAHKSTILADTISAISFHTNTLPFMSCNSIATIARCTLCVLRDDTKIISLLSKNNKLILLFHKVWAFFSVLLFHLQYMLFHPSTCIISWKVYGLPCWVTCV